MIEYFSAGKFYFCQIQSMLIFRSFSVGGFLVVSFFLLFFVKAQTSSCMYHFLVQILLDLRRTQRSRIRALALARNFFEHSQKQTRLKGPLFQFFSALCDFFSIFFQFCLQRVPSIFLILLQQTKVPKNPNGLPC